MKLNIYIVQLIFFIYFSSKKFKINKLQFNIVKEFFKIAINKACHCVSLLYCMKEC